MVREGCRDVKATVTGTTKRIKSRSSQDREKAVTYKLLRWFQSRQPGLLKSMKSNNTFQLGNTHPEVPYHITGFLDVFHLVIVVPLISVDG